MNKRFVVQDKGRLVMTIMVIAAAIAVIVLIIAIISKSGGSSEPATVPPGSEQGQIGDTSDANDPGTQPEGDSNLPLATLPPATPTIDPATVLDPGTDGNTQDPSTTDGENTGEDTSTDDPIEDDEPTEYELLKNGSEGDDVKKLQDRLKELGYLDIDETTTKFGNQTEQAVKDFQENNDLSPVDGIAGQATQELLFDGDPKAA